MIKNQVKIQVLIPTCNSVKEIDRTMKSIHSQTCGMDNIYITIVDFASSDDTYEQLLKYDPYHLGVYQYPREVNKEYQIGITAKFSNFISLGCKTYYMGLFPGTVIYPNFMKCAMDRMGDNESGDMKTIIFETDIRKSNGTVIHQIPLYNKSFILDESHKLEYIKRKFWHQVIWVSANPFSVSRHFTNHVTNNLNDWHRQILRNYSQTVLYIPEHMGCVYENIFHNDFEMLVKDFGALCGLIRTFEKDIGIGVDSGEFETLKINLAYLSLWKAGEAIISEDWKEAEDCFLFSEIFSEDICETELYKAISDSIVSREKQCFTEKRKLLLKEETWNPPKDCIIIS